MIRGCPGWTCHNLHRFRVDRRSMAIFARWPIREGNYERQLRLVHIPSLQFEFRRFSARRRGSIETHIADFVRIRRRLYFSADSAPSSSPTYDEKWHDMTQQQLLHKKVGTFTNATWNQADQILKQYWLVTDADNRHIMCWKILDRLAQEMEAKGSDNDANQRKRQHPRLQTMQILNPVLKQWKQSLEDGFHKQQSKNKSLLPSQVHEKIQYYANVNLFHPDAATYTLLLDTMGHLQHLLPREEGSTLAHQYFEQWLQQYDTFTKNDTAPSPIPKPDLVALGAVLHALAMTPHPKTSFPDGGAKRAEALMAHPLVRKLGILDTGDDKTILYTSMMLAWARAGNPQKTEGWMRRIPHQDSTTQATLMQAWANHAIKISKERQRDSRAVDRAIHAVQEILDNMQLQHEEREHGSEAPHAKTHQFVMDMFSKLADNAAKRNDLDQSRRYADQAHELLQTLQQHQQYNKDNDSYPKPILVHYNTVLAAFRRSKQPEKVEKLFKEMMVTEDEEAKPDIQSFTTLMASYASSKNSKHAGTNADSLLEIMQEYGMAPNIQTYSNYVNAWAVTAAETTKNQRRHQNSNHKSNHRAILKRADSIVQEWREKFNLTPDTYVYTNLLKLYSNCDETEKTLRLLDSWLGDYDRSQDPSLKPNAISFTPVLAALAKAKQAQECHDLFVRARDEYGISPNKYLYATVLEAYAQSDSSVAAEKALTFFNEMRFVDRVQPSKFAWTNIIKALSKHGRLEEAQALLEEMISDKRATKPSAYTFGAVLFGWSRSNRPDALERATALLQRMQDLYDSGTIRDQPNIYCYTSVLSCIAQAKTPGVGQRAENLLQEGMKRYKFEATQAAIHTVMNAWANDGDWTKVLSYYRFLQERSHTNPQMTPDAFTFRILWKAIATTNDLSREDKDHTKLRISKDFAKWNVRLSRDMKQDLQRIEGKTNDATMKAACQNI